MGHFLLNHHRAPSAKELKGCRHFIKSLGARNPSNTLEVVVILTVMQVLLSWGKEKHFELNINAALDGSSRRLGASPPALRRNQAKRYVSRPLSGLPLIPSLVISDPKIVCFYTSLCVWSCRMCASWPPHTNPHLLLRPPQPLLLPPARQAALTLRLARPPVGSNWGFDQNYFFHKQSNWLKSFMCFSNH